MRRVVVVSGVVCVFAAILVLGVGVVTARQDLSDAERRLSSVTADLDEISTALGASGRSIASVIVSLDDRVDFMEGDVDGLRSDVEDTQGELSNIADCINDYMDVVANARGSAYRYFYC